MKKTVCIDHSGNRIGFPFSIVQKHAADLQYRKSQIDGAPPEGDLLGRNKSVIFFSE